MIKELETTIIPIPLGKQAELFDDRVEITDWKPKLYDSVYELYFNNGIWDYKISSYIEQDYQKIKCGLVKRTESEAKLLVEKLKAAML